MLGGHPWSAHHPHQVHFTSKFKLDSDYTIKQQHFNTILIY